MNEQDDQDAASDELEGFETFDEGFDAEAPQEEAAGDEENVADADYQDVSADADVFGDEEAAAEAPRKRKLNWFNIGVAVVAVAVAGGLIFAKLGPQLMGGSGGDQAQMAQQGGDSFANITQGDSTAAAQQAIQPTGAAPSGGGMLDNPEQFTNLVQNPAPAKNAAPAAPADPFAGLSNKPAAPQVAAPPAAIPSTPVPMPAPITAEPAATASSATQAATKAVVPAPTVTDVPMVAPDTVMPAPSMATAADSLSQPADVSELKSQITSLQQKLDALDSRLNNAVESLSSSPAAAPVDDGRLSTIQSTLDRLESRIDALSERRAAPAASSNSVIDGEPAPRKTTSAPKKAAKPKRPSSEYDEPYTPAPASTPVLSQNQSGGWELRGAQPGRAVIAKGGDIREVGVGETIPGLGQITGIAEVNGRWVVQGTSGRLSQ